MTIFSAGEGFHTPTTIHMRHLNVFWTFCACQSIALVAHTSSFEVPRDIAKSSPSFCMLINKHESGIIEWHRKWERNMSNFVVSIMPADGPASKGDSTSAVTVMTCFGLGSLIRSGSALETVRLWQVSWISLWWYTSDVSILLSG